MHTEREIGTIASSSGYANLSENYELLMLLYQFYMEPFPYKRGLPVASKERREQRVKVEY